MRVTSFARRVIFGGVIIAVAVVTASCGTTSARPGWNSPRFSGEPVAVTTPRAIVNDQSEIEFVLFEYAHSLALDQWGNPVYDVLAGPTCSLPESYGQPTPVRLGFHRSAVTTRVVNGSTYVRGSWPVPATRRVRGTTISRPPESGGGSSATPVVADMYFGGLMAHSQEKLDIIFVEPGTYEVGVPGNTKVEVVLLRADGSEQGSALLEAGKYYFIEDDTANPGQVIVKPGVPWNLPMGSTHDPLARAVHDAMRKAGWSSGVARMVAIPQLTP